MQKITPFLWFNNNAEEAMKFYVSVFPNSKMVGVTRYGDGGPKKKGKVMTGIFRINGQEFIALNGGPHVKFNEAVSFVVNCATQQEIDRLWNKLSQGGKPGRCGWLKDKYGLSWQIVPTVLGQLVIDKDPKRSERVIHAMMRMKKLDIKKLKQAKAGK